LNGKIRWVIRSRFCWDFDSAMARDFCLNKQVPLAGKGRLKMAMGSLSSWLKRPRAWQVFHSRRKNPIVVSFIFVAMLGYLVEANPVQAEEEIQEDLPDRLKLYGGHQLLFGFDGKFRFDGSKTGFGSTLDFNDDLVW